MFNNELPDRKHDIGHGIIAERSVASAFRAHGWEVHKAPASQRHRPDLIVRRGNASYGVEIKAASEGRSDRLIPLWSQAYLQALAAAGDHRPLAVVAAPRIPLHAADQVLKFVAAFAPNAGVGVVDFAGLRRFRGPHLDDLNEDPLRSSASHPSGHPGSRELFSDSNQWMLKVLLAPEVPEQFLSAPRAHYANASELARAAGVSVMSASRLVRLLESEGHLSESEPLRLVRREELFRRWQSYAVRIPRELPMRVLLGGDAKRALAGVLERGQACLGMFAAAEALNLGFVHGIPAHIYVSDIDRALLQWKNVALAVKGEFPDFFLRQARARRSIFRGAVRRHGQFVSDVIQVWLDVWTSPARGREQADLIRRRVLDPVIRK